MIQKLFQIEQVKFKEERRFFKKYVDPRHDPRKTIFEPMANERGNVCFFF